MSDILLQTIVEKLEGMELLLKVTATTKENDPRIEQIKEGLAALRKEIQSLPAQLQPVTGKLNELTTGMQRIQTQLQSQVVTNTNIEHRHHLHKGIWVAVGLSVTCFLLAWGWLNSHKSFDVFRANDIKYRYLKTSYNKNALDICRYTDSLYRKDEAGFSAGVAQEEQRIFEQAKLLRLAGEKEREAKTLKEQAGSKKH